MKLLEKLLTRVTMYTLMGAVLSIVIATALVLSLFESVAFTPFELLASTAVFCLASIIINYGLGKLYGIHTHTRSALITALILALLFTPTLDGGTLLQYALIASIAQASKYVLTYGGRHLFNPAAIGALAGGLLSLQFASWWVATPGLFFVTLIGAFLVLYKTRSLLVGSLFVSISALLVVASGLLRGEDLTGVVTVVLTSWPIIFIAGFMLSEPLTLPPRRWQKVIVACVVALIVGLPFSISAFHSSPELALIIGNLVAFGLAFRQRKGLKLTLTARRSLTPTVEEYSFSSPEVLRFEPGQYIELSLPHTKQDMRGVRRSFSVTSRPNEKTLTLGVKFYEPSSSFKRVLRTLPIESSVQTTGITGDFVLPKNPQEKLLFIAGGIGITPFISHLRSLDTPRDITLLYFIRNPSEAAYADTLRQSGIRVEYFVADNPDDQFHLAPYITDDLLRTYVPDSTTRTVYVSGPPVMVTVAKQLLKGRARHIHTDYFSGY